MYSGKLVFAQVMDHLPLHTLHRCVERYRGDRRVRSCSCLDQFLCMAFAQITGRGSLRDLVICLRAQRSTGEQGPQPCDFELDTQLNAEQTRAMELLKEIQI